MLAEIYAQEKLRELETESRQTLHRMENSTWAAYTDKAMASIAGVAFRRVGQRLASWAPGSIVRAETPLTRPADGRPAGFVTPATSRTGQWHE
jgi:hypothetical protein